MKKLVIIMVLLLGVSFIASCGEQATTNETKTDTETATETKTETTTPPAGEFEKYAELDWVKIGVLKGWTETIDQSQKTISLTDNNTKIEISYTISDIPENYEKSQASGSSGKVTTDKVTYGKTEFIRDTIEYAGSVTGVNLYAPYASDGTSIVYINGPLTPDIEKMLGSIEIK